MTTTEVEPEVAVEPEVEVESVDAPSTLSAQSWAEGHVLRTYDEFHTLPVGAVVAYNSTHYIKDNEIDWYYYDATSGTRAGQYGRAENFSLGINRIVSVPVVERTLSAGEVVMTMEALHGLPVETVVRSSRGTSYRMLTDDRYQNLGTHSISRRSRLATAVEAGRLTVAEAPASIAMSGEAEAPETLARFKQRFVTVTLGAAQVAGVSQVPIRSAFRKLGCEEHPLAPGLVVSVDDAAARTALPPNTVFRVGPNDPSAWSQFALYRANQGTLVRLVGGAAAARHGLMTIESMPGVERPAWVDEVMDRSQCEQEIHEFKARAWEIGLRAKEQNSWCSEYENAMGRMGIDETVMMPLPRTLTAEEVAALPVGSIVRFGNGIHFAYYKRDDSSANPARTVRMHGTIDGAWAHNMRLIFDPSEGVALQDRTRVGTVNELDAAPTGTVITDGSADSGRTQYTKNAEGTWTISGRSSYSYRSVDFSVGQMRFVSFGEATS